MKYLIILFMSLGRCGSDESLKYVPLPKTVPALVRSERLVDIADLADNSRAYNGSIVTFQGQTIMAYRFDSFLGTAHAQTQIALTRLDSDLRAVGPISILETRAGPGIKRYTAEDPRLFTYQNTLYVTYNSTQSNEIGGYRQVYLGRLSMASESADLSFTLDAVRQLSLERPEGTGETEKSWVPLVMPDGLFMLYKHDPPEAYQVPPKALPLVSHDGLLSLLPLAKQASGAGKNLWSWGPIRGGTPLVTLPDGRHGAFFHSGIFFDSGFGYNKHYFMGFYVLSADPPFSVEEICKVPILPPSYYGLENAKRIIFPAGVIETKDAYLVSFGLNDATTRIAEVDKKRLEASLTRISKF